MKDIREEVEVLINDRLYRALALLEGNEDLEDVMQMIFREYVYDLIWNTEVLYKFPDKKYSLCPGLIEATTEVDEDIIVNILIDLMDNDLITLDYAPYNNYHMTVNREVLSKVYDEYVNNINRE